jgi:hypothetical protein
LLVQLQTLQMRLLARLSGVDAAVVVVVGLWLLVWF